MMLAKARAFFMKDLISEASYPIAFIGQLGGVLFGALTLYFMSRFLDPAAIPALTRYGGNYFAFVLVGVAAAGYLGVALNGFASQVRQAQMLGTLEALLVTQTGIPAVLFGSSIYSFALTSLRVVLYFLVGGLVLGLPLGDANVGGAIVILVLTIVAFSGLGIFSASVIMVLKKGSPVNWLFNSMSWLLGGVFYPVAVLPEWMQKVAALLPITHTLEGMRLALLRGHSLRQLLPQIVPLLLFIVIVVPLSAVVFAWAVRRAKRDGSLTHY